MGGTVNAVQSFVSLEAKITVDSESERDGCWEHRAFWGADDIAWGVDGSSVRLDIGALPPTGQWVQLAVPASALKLEGANFRGLSFILYNGDAAWDDAGRNFSE